MPDDVPFWEDVTETDIPGLRFKVGDKVMVIDAQDIEEMQMMIGQICTINQVYDNRGYFLDRDQENFIWLDKWLEPYEDSLIEIDENGIFDLLK